MLHTIEPASAELTSIPIEIQTTLSLGRQGALLSTQILQISLF